MRPAAGIPWPPPFQAPSHARVHLKQAFCEGIKVGVSADAPWTDCAYKLVEYDGRPTLKLSAGKQTAPGRKQVLRYSDADGTFLRDTIGLADEGPPEDGGEELLREVINGGTLREQPQDLSQLRDRFNREFDRLPDQHKALTSPVKYQVSVSRELDKLHRALSEKMIGKRAVT